MHEAEVVLQDIAHHVRNHVRGRSALQRVLDRLPEGLVVVLDFPLLHGHDRAVFGLGDPEHCQGFFSVIL